MRFASLGSGSRGNATLIEAGGTRLLLDNGFPLKELRNRLQQLGVEPESLDGVLVTHEHQDHIRGVGPLARRCDLPVWITHGTLRQGRCGELPRINCFHSHQSPFMIGGVEVAPFPVPHDAREPVQYCFRYQGRSLGVLTDSGSVTPHIIEMLSHCDALVLECNHDPGMLAEGPYPPALQRRVAGRLGHLSNRQAAQLLSHLDAGRLRHLVLAHLSEKNNTPELALESILEAAPEIDGRVSLTHQERVCGWHQI